MFFGLTIEKLLLILLVVGLLIGPERLPALAAQLAAIAKRLREFGRTAKERVQDEMGDEFSYEDWQKLDPRRYDPRRIIRDALSEPVLTPGGKEAPSDAALQAARRPPRQLDTEAVPDSGAYAPMPPPSSTPSEVRSQE
jgi:sec-independent protein translocase protein TatB